MSGKITDNLGRSSGLIKGATQAGGKVLQTVFTEASGSIQTSLSTGGTWVENITAAITCASTSNKVFITGCQGLACADNNIYTVGTFYRDTTNLGNSTRGIASGSVSGSGGFNGCAWAASFLDSPSSTSEITYKMMAAVSSNATGYVNVGNAEATLILMEIEG